MFVVNPTTHGRQSIVSTFSQGSVVLIIVLNILLYHEGLQIPFFGADWDDFLHIETTRGNFYRAMTLPPYAYYPLRLLRYAIQDFIHSIFGMNPLPYHVVVLVAHCASSVLVFFIVKKVVNSSLVGLLAALLFASFWAHPEAIVPMYAMHDVLSSFFIFLCIILFYRYRTNIKKKTNYVLALGAFFLGLGIKENVAVVLVPLMYLIDRYVRLESEEGLVYIRLSKVSYIPFILIFIVWEFFCIWSTKPAVVHAVFALPTTPDVWTQWPINFYNAATSSFNLCLLKGPGYGTLFLVFSFVLSFLLDKELKSRIILMGLGWLLSLWPIILVGCTPRYLYIPSAFGMAIFTTCVYHLIAYVIGRFRLKEAYVTALTILIASVFVSTNFFHVKRQIQYFQDVGRVSEALWKPIQADFPDGTLGTRLAFINLPWVYEQAPGKGYIAVRHGIWSGGITFAAVYGWHNIGPVCEYTLPELYNGRHPIIQLEGFRLSPLEFEKLAKEKDTRVYIFNPGNDTILDVTGKDYNDLKKLISSN